MNARICIAGLALAALTGTASAQALSAQGAKPLAELLNDGYAVSGPASNGRPGEVVMVLRKDAKAFVCVLTEIRGENYGEAKAKPAASPCLPLN